MSLVESLANFVGGGRRSRRGGRRTRRQRGGLCALNPASVGGRRSARRGGGTALHPAPYPGDSAMSTPGGFPSTPQVRALTAGGGRKRRSARRTARRTARRSARRHRGGSKRRRHRSARRTARRSARRSARRHRGGTGSVHIPLRPDNVLSRALGSGSFGPPHGRDVAGGWLENQGGPIPQKQGIFSEIGDELGSLFGGSKRKHRKSNRKHRKSNRKHRKSHRKHVKKGGLSSQAVPMALLAGVLGLGSKKGKRKSKRRHSSRRRRY